MSDRSQRKQKRQPRKAQRSQDYQADRDSGAIADYRPDPKPKDRNSGGVISPPPRS